MQHTPFSNFVAFWSGSKLFAKVNSRRQKSGLARKLLIRFKILCRSSFLENTESYYQNMFLLQSLIALLTICILMDSSFWFDIINLGKSIVHIYGCQVIIKKKYCILLSEDLFMPPKELWEAYSNRTVQPSVSPSRFCVRSISPIFFEVGIPNLVCGYILGWRPSVRPAFVSGPYLLYSLR